MNRSFFTTVWKTSLRSPPGRASGESAWFWLFKELGQELFWDHEGL